MSSPNLPDTPDVVNALLTYLQGVQYAGTTNYVYLQPGQVPLALQQQFPTGGVQAGEWKDPSQLLATGSQSILAEIHADDDIAERYTTGGRVNDRTDFPIVSFTNMDNSSAAWMTMFRVRDAIIPYIMAHSQLAGTGNVLLVKLIPGGKYVKVFRGKWYLGYICKVQVTSQWIASTGFVS